MASSNNYYPHAEKLGVNRSIPEKGRSREEVLAELGGVAKLEDDFWQTGKCSGTMYCGDMEHYAFLQKIFGLYQHVNALQRDMCPSMTRFEGEIIAMSLDMMHAEAARPDSDPAGSVTAGGTESILSAVLAYREQGREERGITAPEIILPETSHPAFVKGAHLFGLKAVKIDIDPETTLVDVDAVHKAVTPNTVAIVGSAGNYGYGTIDPIEQLSEIALENNVGLHVDGCLGGFILPWGQELGYDIPVFDFRIPGVTSITADVHKYGFGPKGLSTVLFRDKSLRAYLYFMQQEWSGGKYFSPGLAGSRSGGLLAASWAAMITIGRDGYLRYAKAIFEAAFAMQAEVKKHSELKIMGNPTFCFSFRSDDFDIYHVNDFMKERGWRFNGQQHPNAIHMCTTRPQTQPGVVEAFGSDLAEAVVYAKNPTQPNAISGAIYGGMPKGVPAIEQAIRGAMVGMLDAFQGVPEEEAAVK